MRWPVVVWLYSHRHICGHLFTTIDMPTCMLYILTQTHVAGTACVEVHVYTCMYEHIEIRTDILTHTHTHAHTHTHTTHTHTHVYASACVGPVRLSGGWCRFVRMMRGVRVDVCTIDSFSYRLDLGFRVSADSCCHMLNSSAAEKTTKKTYRHHCAKAMQA